LLEQIPGEDPPDPANFPGCIDVDPLVADAAGADGIPGTIDDDVRLSNVSPCIDAGDNARIPAWVAADLDDHGRRFDDPQTPDSGAGSPPIVDMGAYEFGSSPVVGDLAPPFGTINVADLFVLLSNWGTNGPGADLAPPTNIVDVADLFVLLANWG
jgi:hypothetical protein